MQRSIILNNHPVQSHSFMSGVSDRDEEMIDRISMPREMLRWRPEERVSATHLATGTRMTKRGDKIDEMGLNKYFYFMS